MSIWAIMGFLKFQTLKACKRNQPGYWTWAETIEQDYEISTRDQGQLQ